MARRVTPSGRGERIDPDQIFDKPVLFHRNWVTGITVSHYEGRQYTNLHLSAEGMLAIVDIEEGRRPKDSPEFVNHQDEALAAARRDAHEANKRAAAAERKAAFLEEEIQDYQGEIDALASELAAEKARAPLKALYGVDIAKLWSKSVPVPVPPEPIVIPAPLYSARDPLFDPHWLKKWTGEIDIKSMNRDAFDLMIGRGTGENALAIQRQQEIYAKHAKKKRKVK